jgi:hypothetical protein
MKIAMGVAGLLVLGWGGLLLHYLVAGRIPLRIRRVVFLWVPERWVGDETTNVALWALFSVMAGAFLTIVGVSALIAP